MRMVASVEHAGHAVAGAVVAAIAEEQRVVRIGREPSLGRRRRHRAGLAAVARRAGPAVAAERFLLEQMLAVAIALASHRDRQRADHEARKH